MRLKRFEAESFRNIESCSLSFSDGVNLLHGENAQGKTNAVEGIYLFARGKSFRAKEEREMIRFGDEGFRLAITYEDKDGEESLEYAVFGKERRRKKNGYAVEKITEMIGSFRAVLFVPDDLLLVKGGPEERREFLNVAISQVEPSYIRYYANYKRALENRNCLLKFAQKGLPFDEKEFYSWSEVMAEYASFIYEMRRDYVKKLSPAAARYMKEISDGKEELSLVYESDLDGEYSSRDEVRRAYYEVFTKDVEREKILGSGLSGVHRDDLSIKIDGIAARSYASQGQQRSVVLSLKLSEGEVSKEITGEEPVYLFDDVLSELDEKRRAFVLTAAKDRQIIITSCEKRDGLSDICRVFEVKGGKYQ